MFSDRWITVMGGFFPRRCGSQFVIDKDILSDIDIRNFFDGCIKMQTANKNANLFFY